MEAPALAETQHAFDGVAPTYERSNAENALLCSMRERARRALTDRVRPGSRILDLGCGPGTDAVPLARAGYEVTAIDWSPAMVGEAARSVERAGLDAQVRVHRLGIHELTRLGPDRFDAAYSNFGALNCVPDPSASAEAIADRLKPGALLVASVIGRLCPWELALYGARLDWRRAAVRFSRGHVPVPLEGRRVWTRYYWPRELARIFEARGFSTISIRALGLVTPPPYAHAFASRHPWFVERLQRLEDLIAGWPGIRSWGDHFLIVLRRT